MFPIPLAFFLQSGAGAIPYSGPMMAFGINGYTAFSNDGYSWTQNAAIPADYSGPFTESWDLMGNYLATDGNGNFWLFKQGPGGWDLIKSTDGGATWSTVATDAANGPEFLQYANGRLYTYDQGTLKYTTNDGGSWNNWTDSTTDGFAFMHDIVYTGNEYIIVGFDGTFSGTQIARSTDGVTFSDVTHTQDANEMLYCVGYDSSAGVLVAGGSNGALFSSSDGGQNWTTRALGSSSVQDIADVASNGVEWLLCTGGGPGAPASAEIHRSADDGASWTRTYGPVSSEQLFSLVWDGALWIITGIDETSGNIVEIKTSTDGTASSFTARSPDSPGTGIERTCIQYDPVNDDIVIAAMGIGAGGGD